MIKLYPARSRGVTRTDWLTSKHHFSFGRYQSEDRENFGELLVLNEDEVAPGKGFGAHPHENMEILSLVLEGELAHEDSLGNKGKVKKGEIQYISAGSGIVHSEKNPSRGEKVRFIQLWITPNKEGLPPRYASSTPRIEQNGFTLFASENGKEISLRQNALVLWGELEEGRSLIYLLESRVRGVYLMMISGEIHVEDRALREGDAAAITDVSSFKIEGVGKASFLMIDLPMKTNT